MKMLLKEIFGDKHVVALGGEKSSGKSNNLCVLIKDFRSYKKDIDIYFYGFNDVVTNWLKKFPNMHEFSSLDHLSGKRNCLIIIDEFQKLSLADKRHKKKRDDFFDYIYHNNNWAILSSANVREFNSIIGTIVERWLVKTVKESSLVNGSQLKEAVIAYSGRFKEIESIVTPKHTLVILNSEEDINLENLEYIKEIDKKVENVDIFSMGKK